MALWKLDLQPRVPRQDGYKMDLLLYLRECNLGHRAGGTQTTERMKGTYMPPTVVLSVFLVFLCD